MTRLSALTATAIAAGLSPEQAEELCRNVAARAQSALEDCALAAIEHRLGQGWLEPPECGVARPAEALADAWAEHDAEVEAVLRRLALAVAIDAGFVERRLSRDERAALADAWALLEPELPGGAS